MKKSLIIIAFLFACCFGMNAQSTVIPKEIKLETKEDYDKTESLVLESIDWLSENPIPYKKNKRKELNAFLITWVSGSPTVSVELVEGIVPADCPDCLMMLIGGWVKYSLTNDYSTNKKEAALAGINMLIDFYSTNKKSLGKNKVAENLIKLKKKGELEQFIKSKF